MILSPQAVSRILSEIRLKISCAVLLKKKIKNNPSGGIAEFHGKFRKKKSSVKFVQEKKLTQFMKSALRR